MRIQKALLTVQFTFQFNHCDHFAPSVHQQTPASSSYTCSRFCSSSHHGPRLTTSCFIRSRLCYWGFTSCYIYVLLEQCNMHVSCSIRSTWNAKFPYTNLSRRVVIGMLRTLDQLHWPISDNLPSEIQLV